MKQGTSSYRPTPAIEALYDRVPTLGLPHNRGSQSGEKLLKANAELLMGAIIEQAKASRSSARATPKLLKAA